MLEQSDLESVIRLNRLDQITDETDTLVENAIAEAESIVTDYLYQHYNTELIFSKTGSDRSKTVLNWLKHIAMYQLYERIPDELVPERIIKNYNDTIQYLKEISGGDHSLNLPRRTTEGLTEAGQKKTKFKWGSQKQRSN